MVSKHISSKVEEFLSDYEIPLMPRIRNSHFDYIGTVRLWNSLADHFTRKDFLRIISQLDRSESWGYSRLNYWIKENQIIRLRGGEFIKSERFGNG